MAVCNKTMRAKDVLPPRRCGVCGLGPCREGKPDRLPHAEQSPMGYFYKISGGRGHGDRPTVYRCQLGEAWERMDVYELGEITPSELRFIADLIDEHQSAA